MHLATSDADLNLFERLRDYAIGKEEYTMIWGFWGNGPTLSTRES